MALHIRDPETDRLVRRLADLKKVGITEAVKLAVANELKAGSVTDAVRAIQQEIASWPDTGLKADKAFFDELSGET